MARRQLILACLLAISSHGWAADLDPECYELYDQFLAADWVNVGRIAGRMHDIQCWPALQASDAHQPSQPVISSCTDLVPHVIQMVNDQAHANGYSILQIYDAKAMTYQTIDRVANNMHELVTNAATGQSLQVPKKLKHDDKIYVRGEGHYLSWVDWKSLNPNAVKYGSDGTVLVPNSEPFAASPLAGATRLLDCSGEARYTDGTWLIQMYLDRDPNGQEFVSVSGLTELR